MLRDTCEGDSPEELIEPIKGLLMSYRDKGFHMVMNVYILNLINLWL